MIKKRRKQKFVCVENRVYAKSAVVPRLVFVHAEMQ